MRDYETIINDIPNSYINNINNNTIFYNYVDYYMSHYNNQYYEITDYTTIDNQDYETINYFTIYNNVLINNNIFIAVVLLLSIVCAIFTILSKNPIVSVLFLIGLYVNIAGYLILIGSQFIGLAYILIYIGAISILFIFILMLINIRISELVDNSQNSVSLIIILAFILNFVIYNFILNSNYLYNLLYNNYNIYDDKLFYISNIIWDSNIIQYNSVSSIGNTLYSNYFILFIIASIILLLAMIGAIIITIRPLEHSNIK